MKTVRLILKEVLHRKLNFLISVLGVVVAVTLLVFFTTSSNASRRETALLMRNIGLNLRIIPRQTDMNRFWREGFSEHTMPEAFLERLSQARGLNYAHMVGALHKRVEWRGRPVILSGLAPEVSAPGKPKPVMSFNIKPGTVYVGFELARDLGLKKGMTVDLLGESFAIARCLAESGTDDDVRIYAALSDVQRLVKLPGRINEIKALNCVCLTTEKDPLEMLRAQLERILPEAKVLQMRAIAHARKQQRLMIERYLAFILPFVLVVSVAWVGLLAMMNVRERRQEIGILRAIGHGSGKIASLFLGKAVLVGALGAVVGFAAGTGLALVFGPDIFRISAAKSIQPLYWLLAASMLGAPLFAMLAGLIPTTVAVTQDPAVTLSQE